MPGELPEVETAPAMPCWTLSPTHVPQCAACSMKPAAGAAQSACSAAASASAACCASASAPSSRVST